MNLAIPASSHRHFSFGTWWHARFPHQAVQTGLGKPLQYITQEIAKNGIVEVQQPLGVTIECLEGSVWVTLDNDARDVVLEVGQTFVVDRNQRTLLLALTAARVRLMEPARLQ